MLRRSITNHNTTHHHIIISQRYGHVGMNLLVAFSILLPHSFALLEAGRFWGGRTRNNNNKAWLPQLQVASSSEDSSQNTRGDVRVGIVGAGAIAFGTAAVLAQNAEEGTLPPMLFSPSGASTCEFLAGKNLVATGAIGDFEFSPRIAKNSKQLVEENDVLIIALPANGHKQVFQEIAPFIRHHQRVIISSHASLGALYFSQLLRERTDLEKIPPITAWGTTVCTARRNGNQVRVNTVRQAVDTCTIPDSKDALVLCQNLFPGVQFVPRSGLLAISLSNVNPQNHLGIALGNMGRMEKGEKWYQLLNITPSIGRFLEALDKERLEIANALNVEVKTIFEHFHLSFHVPISDSISDMNQKIHTLGNDVYGPDTADSRYVTEDVPFGLGLTIVLGEMVGKPAILHQAGMQIVSSMYGRDFMAENNLLDALHLDQYSLKEIEEASFTGVLEPQNKEKARS